MAEANGRGEFVKALIAAKKGFKALKKEKVNPFFKSKYADLAALHEAIDDSLEKNGLFVSQPITLDEKGSYLLRTTVEHVSGHKLESVYMLPGGVKPQDLGAAVTYGRRISLSSLLAIPAEDDDDGNATNPEAQAPAAGGMVKKGKEYKLPPKDEAPKGEPVAVTDLLVASVDKFNDSWWKVTDLSKVKYACTPEHAKVALDAFNRKKVCKITHHKGENGTSVIDTIEVDHES